jgi:hypothetical protein
MPIYQGADRLLFPSVDSLKDSYVDTIEEMMYTELLNMI